MTTGTPPPYEPGRTTPEPVTPMVQPAVPLEHNAPPPKRGPNRLLVGLLIVFGLLAICIIVALFWM